MKNRNRIEIMTDILSIVSKNDNQTIIGISDTIELKTDLVDSYLGLLESEEYLSSSDGHTESDAQYFIAEKGEKLLKLLEKEYGWD